MGLVEAFADGTEPSPAQLLTPQQRATLLAYGRLGDQRLVAAELGIGQQTVKNHLSQAYSRLGVASAPQAIYMLMGGEQTALQVPEASNDVRGLRRRVEVLERQLSEAEIALQANQAIERARHMASAPARGVDRRPAHAERGPQRRMGTDRDGARTPCPQVSGWRPATRMERAMGDPRMAVEAFPPESVRPSADADAGVRSSGVYSTKA